MSDSNSPEGGPPPVPETTTTRKGFIQRAAGLVGSVLLRRSPGVLFEQPQAKTDDKTPDTETKPASVFDLLRDKVSAAAGSDKERADYLTRLNELEGTQKVIDQFIAYHESVKDENGQPLLLSLYKKRFGNLPIDITEEIFFLKDNKLMQQYQGQMQELVNNPWTALPEIKSQMDQLKVPTMPRGGAPLGSPTYLEVGSKKDERSLEILADKPPKDPAAFESDKPKILSMMKQFPIVQKVVVILTGRGRYDPTDKQATTYEGGGHLPDENGDSLVLVDIPLGLTERAKYVVNHETGHSMDIDENWSMYRSFMPPEIVDLMILREQTMANPTWGRNYPNVDRLFSGDTLYKDFPQNDPYMKEPNRLAVLTNNYPDGLWFYTRNADNEYLVGDRFIRMGYASEKLGLKDFREHPAVKDFLTKAPPQKMSWYEFIDKAKPVLEQIGREDPQWKYVFDLFNQKQELLLHSWWPKQEGTNASWIGNMFSVIPNVFLSEQVFTNPAELAKRFKPENVQKFGEYVRGNILMCDLEKFADSVALAISADEKGVFPKAENPFIQYLQAMQKLRPAQLT